MKIIKCVTEKLINIIKTYSKEDKKILGRWNIESCSKKLDTKIDLANEDNCGPCGYYILEKLKITKTTKQAITNETSPWLMAEQEEKENKN